MGDPETSYAHGSMSKIAGNRFELEALEPRVLLSVSPVPISPTTLGSLSAVDSLPASLSQPSEQIQVSPGSQSDSSSWGAGSAGDSVDLFGDLPSTPPVSVAPSTVAGPVGENGAVAVTDPAVGLPSPATSDSPASADASLASAQVAPVWIAPRRSIVTLQDISSPTGAPADTANGPMAGQLVDSLAAANGPPAPPPASTLASCSVVQTADGKTLVSTPDGLDTVVITGSGSGEITLTGTANGSAFESLSLHGVTDLTLDTAANESSPRSHSLTLAGGLPAAGLQRLAIRGGSGSDTLLLLATDLPTLAAGLPGAFTFDGAGGSDSIQGPAGSIRWNVTGRDSGNVLGLSFVGVENLVGADGNQDTFVLSGAGILSGALQGGVGGFDSVILTDATYDTVVYRTTGPDSGFIDLDGQTVTYSGMEPITDNTTVTNRVFTGTGSADLIRLRNGPTGAQLTIESENGTFESHTFSNPTSSLTIDGGPGDDKITVEALPNYAGTVSLTGGAGVNTLAASTGSALTLNATTLSIATSGGPEVFSFTQIQTAALGGASLNSTGFAGGVVFTQGVPDWVAQGPTAVNGGQVSGITTNTVSGAITSVAVDPKDSNVIYVGTAGGGIWKTTQANWASDGIDNNGNGLTDAADPTERPAWTPLTDQFPSLSVTAIAVDPVDSKVVWAGTGQASSSGAGGRTIGLMKSSDGGATWKIFPSVFADQGRSIHVIVPTSIVQGTGRLVFVGSDATPFGPAAGQIMGGLMQSTDGGNGVFGKVSGNFLDGLDNDRKNGPDDAGENNGLPAGTVTDIKLDPSDATGKSFYVALVNAGPDNGVYHTADGGLNWTSAGGVAIPAAATSIAERILLSVSSAAPYAVYAALITPNQGALTALFDPTTAAARNRIQVSVDSPFEPGDQVWVLGAAGAEFATIERIDRPNTGVGASATRSEERRVGKECRSRWSPYH